ncbi:MAG TPA: glutamate--tRNA ligase [Anaerolineales bacterium]|nr:glutamate--tRNA ligase [Anaerolineales bacterium]
MTSPARTRFAPSPTGRTHIGSARTALYDFLLARQSGGQFILRIEDTDVKRTVAGAEAELMDSLRWLGLEWDEGPDVGGPCGPYRQSERAAIYRQHTQRLLDEGHAYPCFCSPERLAQMRQDQQKRKEPPRYDGLCRDLAPAEALSRIERGESYVVRFRTPRQGTTTAVDLLRGPITVENATIDDYVLVRSDGLPVYHLAAMVDDHLMRISHVLRSSEWLPTFPLHALVVRALGWPEPVWVHLSVFLSPSGKGKMSKRHAVDAKGGALSIYPMDLRDLGYLPEGVLNWLALMGWSYDDRTEIFTLADLVQRFSVDRLHPSPAAVNFTKLDHFNGIHLRALPLVELTRRLLPFFHRAGLPADAENLGRIAPLLQERIRTLDEAVEMAGFFFRDHIEVAPSALHIEGRTPAESAVLLQQAHDAAAQVENWQAEEIERPLRSLADQTGLTAGQLFGAMRMAITGQAVSPPLFETMEIIGRAICLDRLGAAARQARQAG